MFLETEDQGLEAGEEERDKPGEAHHQPRHQPVLLLLERQEGSTDGDVSDWKNHVIHCYHYFLFHDTYPLLGVRGRSNTMIC